MAKTGAGTTPVLFQGAYFDAAIGLYKMGARYYDPAVGRFTQQDPIAGGVLNPQSLNRYAFVGDNPISGTDPSGYLCLIYLGIAGSYFAQAAFFFGLAAILAMDPLTIALAYVFGGLAILYFGIGQYYWQLGWNTNC